MCGRVPVTGDALRVPRRARARALKMAGGGEGSSSGGARGARGGSGAYGQARLGVRACVCEAAAYPLGERAQLLLRRLRAPQAPHAPHPPRGLAVLVATAPAPAPSAPSVAHVSPPDFILPPPRAS